MYKKLEIVIANFLIIFVFTTALDNVICEKFIMLDFFFQPTKFGDRPIHEAVVHGRIGAIEELLQAGVDINSKNSITRQTALQLAVLAEQKEVVDLLIQKNVAIDM